MYLKRGLSLAEVGTICMSQCRSLCCQGPQFLVLSEDEAAAFNRHAARLGVIVQMERPRGRGGTVSFFAHEGERCPMLDEATSACRIYDERPQRCREFPDRPRPGCAISGDR